MAEIKCDILEKRWEAGKDQKEKILMLDMG